MRWGLTVSLLTALLAANVSVGVAQDADTRRTAQARAFFDEGRALAEAEHWDEAADRFRRALALRESASIRYNLAVSLSHTGQLLEATEELRRVDDADDAPPDVRVAARDLRTQVEARLGSLHVDVAAEGADWQVRVDDEPVPSALVGVAAPVDPGAHRVELFVGGARVDGEEVDIPEGGAATVSLTAPAAPPVVTEPAAEARAEPSGRHGELPTVLGIATAVVGVAAAALTVASFALRWGDYEASNAAYEANPIPERFDDAQGLSDQVLALSVVADVLWAATLGLGVSAIVLGLENAETPDDSLAVAIGPGSVALRARFP